MTTFRIGGSAKSYVEVATREELVEALRWGSKHGQQCLIMGGGSNILAADKGVDGLVVKIANNDLTLKGSRLQCGAGTTLAKAMITANGNGLSGLEWAIGIPGTVGGAVRGNAGACGGHIGSSVETVEIYNMVRGNFEHLSGKDCLFRYRGSAFTDDKNLVVWNADLKLEQKDPEEIKRLVASNLGLRQQTQPKLPSAGSVFKNISLEKLKQENENLAGMAERLGKTNHGLVAAGWIVDLLGFKGRTIGGAKISLEHANFIVNTGKATAEDVIMLISLIKQQARTKLGIQLHEEIQYFGI
jgi:UDP-N-acetylmuramate dehydrogenase